MQILLLGLFVLLYLHDATTGVVISAGDGSQRIVEALPGDVWPHLGPLPVALLVLGPKLLLALVYQTACMRTRRKLGQSAGQRSLNRLEFLSNLLPLLLLCLFACDLALGGLRVIRLSLQHVVLLDELIVMLPTLLVAVLSWWSYYPVDRRLRDSAIIRSADLGRPVYPLLSRGQYVSMQVRHQFGLMLLPLLAVFGWSEALVLLGPDFRGLLSTRAVMLLTPVGVLGVFILAPLMIRHVWHTTPLAAGEVRDRMLALCDLHRVRVRELLLWRTGGGMINAAVTGLISKVRFILLSDGLLDHVAPREVEAVMAHELAHVKLRHIVWMVAVLLSSLGLAEVASHFVIDQVIVPTMGASLADSGLDKPIVDLNDPDIRMIVTALPTFGLTLLVFGWVSRRIERQADVFAARHLAQSSSQRQYNDAGQLVFDPASVGSMVHALQRVADLNHVPAKRKSWRHGSIAWRQQHLLSLIGQPVLDTPVDRVLVRVKLVTLLALAVVLLATTDGGNDLTQWLTSASTQ